MNTEKLLDRTIETETDVREFFEALKAESFIFHPDDLGESYMNKSGRTFTDEEAEKFDKILDDCHKVCSSDSELIYTICLEVFDPEALEES
jgi:hypothetical protein